MAKLSKIFQSATSEIPPSKDFADTDTNFAYFETYSLLFAYFETLIAYFESVNGTNAAGGGGGNGTLKTSLDCEKGTQISQKLWEIIEENKNNTF